MSGLLRRIKRSRAADAGETTAEGQPAAPEGTPTTAENPAAALGRAEHAEAEAPVVAADPSLPAGVDPAAVQPPRGRRGRLRRRVRYLRRARELMLRDLGGLLYEVHRTGGGDVAAHAKVIGAKVERIATLDAEAGAIETALSSPRTESVVFQPGVGGTCDQCGELYGSAALFCSNCGAPTSPAARATPAPGAEPAREVPAMPKAPAKEAPATASEAPTQTLAAGSDKPADAAEEMPASEEPAPEAPAPGEPASEEPAAGEPEPAAGDASKQDTDAGDERAGGPFSGLGNGRAEEHTPPGLSSGDPLARESRS